LSAQFSSPIKKLKSHFMPILNIRAAQLCVIFHTSEFFLSPVQFFFKKITPTIIWPGHMDGKANQQKHKNG